MVAQVTPFNFTPIRNIALGLIKKYGRQCVLLRTTEATPADSTMPWRVTAGTVTEYPFRGPVTGLPFPKRSDPIVDQTECDVIMPGDVDTDSNGNVVSLPIEPLMTDRMRVLGVIAGETDPEFSILGVQRVDPDGNGIMFKVRCRAWSNNTQPPPAGL